MSEKRLSRAKAHADSVGYMQGLKPPPPSEPDFTLIPFGILRGVKPPPPSEDSCGFCGTTKVVP
jgi:hypothetical protein